jgi:PAS domain S-box-containing protein
MKLRNSLAIPIIFILVFVAFSTLFVKYYFNIQTLRKAIESREEDKTEDIYFIINSMIKGEVKNLTALSKVLKENRDLAAGLVHYYKSGGDLEPLRKVMDQLYSKLAADVFLVTDLQGIVIYRANDPSSRGDDHNIWGLDEALAGEDMVTSMQGPHGWAIRALAPVLADQKIQGVLFLGTRIDDKFAKKIAVATNTQVSFGNLTGILASSFPPEQLRLIDKAMVERSLLEKRPFFYKDNRSHTTFMYAPISVVDETFSLIVVTESPEIAALLKEKARRLILLSMVIFIVVIALGSALTFYLIFPLGKLRSRALGVIKEISGEDRSLEVQGNEIQTLSQAFDLMLLTLRNHIKGLKQAEEAQREGERFLASVFASIQDGLSILDKEFNIIGVNPPMERAYSQAMPLVGKKCYEAYHGRREPCEICPARQTLATREAAREIVVEEGAGGEPCRYIDLFTFPLIDMNSGRMKGVVEHVRDITEQKRAEEALKDSEEKYRLLVSQIPAMVFKGYGDWSIEPFDWKVETLTGYAKEDFDSRRVLWRDLIPEEDMPYVERKFVEALKTDKSYVREHRLRKKNGEIIWVQCRGQIFCDAQGNVDYISGVSFDITARKKAEEAVREGERFLANIFNSIQDGIIILDTDFNIIRVNPSLERWFAHALPLVGKKCYGAIHGGGKPCKICPYRQFLETGKATSKVASRIGEDGTAVGWLEVHVFPITEPATGKITGAIEYIRDITERKQTEDRLCESESRYSTLLENLPQKIFLKDKKSVYISCNKNYALDLGISPKEINGRTDYDFYPKELAEKYRIDDKRVMEEGSYADIEEHYIQGGKQIWVHTVKTPVRDERGNTIGILGIFWDISDRKRAEEERHLLEQQLRQAQKMEAVGQLAGGVAHDFNNILTGITGYSELLLMNLNDQDPLRHDVEEIKNAAERAASLTRQLLAFSRKQMLKMQPLDLNVVVANMDRMLKRIIGEDIELVTIPGPGRATVKADLGQMEQVILNLAVNARDAMPQGGKLTIETAILDLDGSYAQQHLEVQPGSYVMLAISDTGLGLDRETQARIFEPFFTTKEPGQGTGLGLSTVYGIIKQSRGHIFVYSEPGQGTTFKIYLPRLEDAVALAQPGEPRAPSLPGTETILLVEDEDMVRQVARRILERNGYTVKEAGLGAEALLISGQNSGPIHLLLTDVVMPGMSGRELAEHLTQQRPGIKVLYMSGHTENAIVHHGALEEGIAFIQKPFKHDLLVQKVREVLDRPPSAPG